MAVVLRRHRRAAPSGASRDEVCGVRDDMLRRLVAVPEIARLEVRGDRVLADDRGSTPPPQERVDVERGAAHRGQNRNRGRRDDGTPRSHGRTPCDGHRCRDRNGRCRAVLGRGAGAGSTRRGRCVAGRDTSNSMAPKYGSGNCQSFWANAAGEAMRPSTSDAVATARRMERFLSTPNERAAVRKTRRAAGRWTWAIVSRSSGRRSRSRPHRCRPEA